jgi:hypothetical protein
MMIDETEVKDRMKAQSNEPREQKMDMQMKRRKEEWCVPPSEAAREFGGVIV